MTAPNLRIMPYYGSKARLAQWIIAHFPPHLCYVEPFGGSAAVLLRKARSKIEMCNDLDQRVVNLFRVLRDPVQAAELRRLVHLTPYSRVERDHCLVIDGDPVEDAHRLLVRAWQTQSQTGATGTWRGSWSLFKAFGGGRRGASWIGLPEMIERVTERLRGVQIECRPALQVLHNMDGPETLFYLDPPYPAATRSRWGSNGYRHEMTDDDHRELARAVHALRGMAIVSSYHGLYDELYADWQTAEIQTHTDGRARHVQRTEVLYLSPAVTARARQGRLPLPACSREETHER